MFKKLLLLTINICFSLFCIAQSTKKFEPSKIITLNSIPNLPTMKWEGGIRNQISPWDNLATISNISEPTLSVYLPETAKANGTALIIAPGGGFHLLSIDNEGKNVAEWCVANGIAAFVLQYRLVPTGENPSKEFMDKLQKSQEQMDKEMNPFIQLAKADGLAAITYVRANASMYGVKENQIGITGFSAGGTVAGAAGLEYKTDAERPDFIAPIYGALHVLNIDKLPAKPMPLFMAVSSDDFFGFQAQSIQLYKTWNAAKAPAELHIYEKGNHGFGMKKQGLPSDEWINAFAKWLESNKFLNLQNIKIFAAMTTDLYDNGKVPNAIKTTVKEESFIIPSTDGKENHFIMNVSKPEITSYLPSKEKMNGMAVIICPGGGYSGVAIDHEGYDVAKRLNEKGISAFVLKYRTPRTDIVANKEVVPLQDAQRAIQYVRENAKSLGINPNKVGIMGSSAGGHLAATSGVHFSKAVIENIKKTNLRPDFMILNYPVISFADNLTHYGSRFNLIGEMPIKDIQVIMADWQNSEKKLAPLAVDKKKKLYYSNELQVTSNTPPTFITHAKDDNVVKVENSILFIEALKKNKVPVESYFYEKGGHGYGMDNPTSDVKWMDKCINWMLNLK